MFRQQRVKCHRLVWVLWGFVIALATQASLGAEQTPRVGTLHVEGQGIERLVLQSKEGSSQVLDRPEPSVVLPEGRYYIQQIALQGGHSCHRYDIPYDQRIVEIDPGVPALLRLGAPLRQVVQVERRGALMVLNYKLVGRGGESYAVNRNSRSERPAFTIHKGQRKIVSGRFEYG